MSKNTKTESVEYKSIYDFICDADNERIVIPEVTGKYLWNIKKTAKLFEQLIREKPAGPFTFDIPMFDVNTRNFDVSNNDDTESDSIHEMVTNKESQQLLLLDGHQRLTAVYRVVTGVNKLWVEVRNNSPAARNPEDSGNNSGNRKLKIISEESEKHLSILISDVYQHSGADNSTLRKLFENTKYAETLIDASVRERNFTQYKTVFRKLDALFFKVFFDIIHYTYAQQKRIFTLLQKETEILTSV